MESKEFPGWIDSFRGNTEQQIELIKAVIDVAVQDEREACARIVEALPIMGGNKINNMQGLSSLEAWGIGVEDTMKDVAAAIRVRGNQDD